HAPGVDGEGGVRLRLGLIDEVVRSAVDDHVGPHLIEGRPDGFRPVQVDAFARQRHHLTGEARAQIAAELAGSAQDDGFHGDSCYLDRGAGFQPAMSEASWKLPHETVARTFRFRYTPPPPKLRNSLHARRPVFRRRSSDAGVRRQPRYWPGHR